MRRLAPVLATALVFVVITAAAAAGDIVVTVNGSPLSTDVLPALIDGRMLVPLRAIFDALGARVEWIGHSQTVVGLGTHSVVVLAVGSPSAEIHSYGQAVSTSRTVPLDVPARIVDGRTLVPLRFISETLGAAVHYDPVGRTASVSGYSPASDPPPWEYSSLLDRLRQEGITQPGTRPPQFSAYTFGTGPIGLVVTSARKLQTLEVGGTLVNPPAGHEWFWIRVSVCNAGSSAVTVNPGEFTVTAGNARIGTHDRMLDLADRFETTTLAAGASTGGVLLFCVPHSSSYNLIRADASGDLTVQVNP